MDFKPFHDYNRLVRRGIKKPLVCYCGYSLVLEAKEIDGELEPVLTCYFCGTLTVPGLTLYDSIKAQADEFN